MQLTGDCRNSSHHHGLFPNVVSFPNLLAETPPHQARFNRGFRSQGPACPPFNPQARWAEGFRPSSLAPDCIHSRRRAPSTHRIQCPGKRPVTSAPRPKAWGPSDRGRVWSPPSNCGFKHPCHSPPYGGRSQCQCARRGRFGIVVSSPPPLSIA